MIDNPGDECNRPQLLSARRTGRQRPIMTRCAPGRARCASTGAMSSAHSIPWVPRCCSSGSTTPSGCCAATAPPTMSMAQRTASTGRGSSTRYPCSSVAANGPSSSPAWLQRAELLNLILRDLYGPRSLLRKGLIPPDLVYADAGFLRACVVPPATHAPGLSLYAADLVRDADGQFRVLKDCTQAPSGMGYALENRTVMSRLIPSLFRDSHPHRLAPFFRRLREIAGGPGTRCPTRQPAGGDHDPRAAQRNLFRAPLPLQLPRLHPHRGRQPDRARGTRLAQIRQRSGTGGRHSEACRWSLL